MKKYFKDLDTETKVKIVMNNENLRDKAYNDCYENNMNMQLEEGELMLGKDNNGFDIRDNYSSFFLVLRDWRKFINNLDSDYLCDDGLELYKTIMNLVNEQENLDSWNDNYDEKYNELDEKIENYCEELLNICEKQLHEYENITEEDVEEYLKFNFEDNYLYENYYIVDDDTSKVYNDVSYTQTFE